MLVLHLHDGNRVVLTHEGTGETITLQGYVTSVQGERVIKLILDDPNHFFNVGRNNARKKEWKYSRKGPIR